MDIKTLNEKKLKLSRDLRSASSQIQIKIIEDTLLQIDRMIREKKLGIDRAA